MKYKLLAVLTLFLLCTRVWGGELFAYRDSVKNGYNFLLYIPDSYAEREGEVLPVIVCLHGRSRAGTCSAARRDLEQCVLQRLELLVS